MKLPNFKGYPKTINVRDEIYQIRMVKRVPGEDRDCMGLCDDELKVIWIKKGQTPRGLMRSLIHELLHAAEGEYDLRLKHEQVYTLETALEALITDNFMEEK